MSKIGIGVIGTGFAKSVQIPAFKLCPDAEIVAVCSSRAEKAEATAREFGIPHAFSDYSDLLRLPNLDLVSIATPPHLHHAMSIAAAEAGKHILCEKPMAMNIGEATEMYQRAEKRGILHYIDFELRFNPTRRKLKELIEGGFLGRLRRVTATVSASFNVTPESRPWNWWSQKSTGGGILGANGSHYIDLLRWYFGEIRAVSGQLATLVPMRKLAGSEELRPVETDDLCVFLCEFENGGQGTVVLSTVDHHAQGHRLEAFGDEGSIVLDGQGRLWGAKKGQAQLTEMTEPDPAAALDGITRNMFPMSFVHFARALVEGVKRGTPVAGAATFFDGMKSQQVMDAVSRSWIERRWVVVGEIQAE